MKTITARVALFCANVFSFQTQTPLNAANDASLKVPGENPLQYCDFPNEYILQVQYLDLTPNPPKPGQILHIHAVGNLTQTIYDGSKVRVVVSLGLIRIFSREYDMCDSAKAIDEECPFREGLWNTTKEIKLPSQIPPGKFNVKMQAYTEEEKEITCMSGSVDFSISR